jgi:molybdate transport system substrate-binding protein
VAAAKEQASRSIEDVAIPNADNATAIYAGAEVKGAAHPEAAEAWLDFMRSPEALQIFERYGFKPYAAG